MTERINYEAQINQVPYSYIQPQSSNKRKIGMMVAGGLIGMNAYYIPVKKDVFVQRGFDIKRNDNFSQIRSLKNIAKEIEKNEVSTESKMILQQMGLSEDINAITAKCDSLEKEVTDKASVKQIKDKFIDCFDRFKNKTHLMDGVCSDAYREVRRNKFKWGVGIGAGVGLALGLIGSRD